MTTNLDTNHPLLNNTPSNRVMPAVVMAFGSAAALWVLAVITHHPAVNLRGGIAGPALMAALVGSSWWWSRHVAREQRVFAGTLAGVLVGCLNLLILGSKLTSVPEGGSAPAPGTSGLSITALLAMGGSILTSGVLGLIGGVLGAWTHRATPAGSTTRQAWLGRLGVVACVATVPLLALGGLVTSSHAGMSVPDWPGTYGANMFLYPLALMADPRVFLEHTHRLFGVLVGLTTLCVLVTALRVERRGWMKWWAAGLMLAVCVQGYLGGKRVTDSSVPLAIVHGVLAQLYFAGVVAWAAWACPGVNTARPLPEGLADRARTRAWTLLGVVTLQLVFGAMYRHGHSPHALYSHIGLSVIVLLLAVVTGFKALALGKAHPGGAGEGLRRWGGGCAHSTMLQFLLGWLAFWAVLTYDRPATPTAQTLAQTPEVSPVLALIRTLHQLNGALLLAVVTLGLVWAIRASRRGLQQA